MLPADPRHEIFMQEALVQARKAFAQDEVPIGCVIVKNGDIIARSYNKVEQRHTQCAHAELLGLQKAGEVVKNWRLVGCWIYITLEPCSMCMHAIALHRLSGVVYGADSPLFGYTFDTKGCDWLYQYDTMRIISGVCSEQSGQLLREFFKNKRCVYGG